MNLVTDLYPVADRTADSLAENQMSWAARRTGHLWRNAFIVAKTAKKRNFRYTFDMGNEAHLRAIAAFEQIQGEKGDGGCFAELYPVLRSAAAKLLVAKSFLGEREYERRLDKLQAISNSLPDMHDESILTSALENISQITIFKHS